MSSFIGVIRGSSAIRKTIAQRIDGVIRCDTDLCLVLSTAENDRLISSDLTESAHEHSWIVSGIGLSPSPDIRILNRNDWQTILSEATPDLSAINGHFAALSISSDSVDLYTDQLGMRSIFMLRIESGILFSTRLDWLLPFSSGNIDWETFGEHWLSVNPFSGQSFITDIERVCSGGHIQIKQDSMTVSQLDWSPSQQEIAVAPESYLTAITETLYKKNNQLSLGLSGGIDSRFLLSILHGNEALDFDLYTFSGLSHPDEKAAATISQLIGKSVQFMDYSIEDLSLNGLRETVSRTMLNGSISVEVANPLYRALGHQQKTVIDGGIGELGRRRYLKGLEVRGKSALFAKNYAQLVPFFRAQKADVFVQEIQEIMENGFRASLKRSIESMPEPVESEWGNWLDLFSIRTRLKNSAGLNQELVDDQLFHVMPFVQPDFLAGVLSMPESARKNARWYRAVIKKSARELQNVSLVKGDEVYPYWMNDFLSTAWLRVKKYRNQKHPQNSPVVAVLKANEEEIRAILHHETLLNSEIYDAKKVAHLISAFYDENRFDQAQPLHWALSFELFRKSLTHEKR